METIVIYSTRFGSTEKYAFEIAKRLQCSAVKSQHVSREDLANYDLIIFGSCLLEGMLTDAHYFQDWVHTYPDKIWALFTVGLSNPALTNFSLILRQNFDEMVLSKTTFFHYRGTIQYKRLVLMQDLIQQMKVARAHSLDQTPLSDENQALLEKYGTYCDAADLASIDELIQWVNKIERKVSQ